MILVAPDYFGDFRCIAGACRHSCCVGWEIDIDDDSHERYQRASGAFGERLRRSMTVDDAGAHFSMTQDERCPLLNRDGLCDMIIEMGEDSLCQICADHPRFRNFFSDRTEIGLGMCCEAAAALVLSREEPVKFAVIDDDGTAEDPDGDEGELIELRDALIDIAQDRRFPVAQRLEHILDEMDISLPDLNMARWRDFLLTLERMDEAWKTRLDSLCVKCGERLSEKWEAPLEQLLVYLIWRQLPGALDDGDAEGRVAFIALMWHVMRSMFIACGADSLAELADIARLYSSEIEYSSENVGAIIDELYKMEECK